MNKGGGGRKGKVTLNASSVLGVEFGMGWRGKVLAKFVLH